MESSKVAGSNRAISTPLFVRWQRMHHRLIPVLAVLLGTGAAWRLWREAPRVTAIGQVDIETVDVRSPASGEEVEIADGTHHAPRVFDSVGSGQPIARVRKAGGQVVDVISPIAGQIIKSHFQPGDTVSSGDRLFTIAADQGVSITTYVRSDQPMRPEPGMQVDVRERSDGARDMRAVIERVGPQYERIPAAQLRDRKAEEWGLPVIIMLPQNTDLKPGELVYIGWLPSTAVD